MINDCVFYEQSVIAMRAAFVQFFGANNPKTASGFQQPVGSCTRCQTHPWSFLDEPDESIRAYTGFRGREELEREYLACGGDALFSHVTLGERMYDLDLLRVFFVTFVVVDGGVGFFDWCCFHAAGCN